MKRKLIYLLLVLSIAVYAQQQVSDSSEAEPVAEQSEDAGDQSDDKSPGTPDEAGDDETAVDGAGKTQTAGTLAPNCPFRW